MSIIESELPSNNQFQNNVDLPVVFAGTLVTGVCGNRMQPSMNDPNTFLVYLADTRRSSIDILST